MPSVDQIAYDRPAYVIGVAASGAANTCNMVLTVKNANGRPTGPTVFDLWLSDSATTMLDTAFTASGTVGGTNDGVTGQDMVVHKAKKSICVRALANGTYGLTIVDTVKNLFVICAQIDGVSKAILTLVTANYG
jgi:hypothetical protein